MQRRNQLVRIIMILVLLGGSAFSLATQDITLQDLEGKPHSFAELRDGKPTVLIFWATWCGHCRAEIPRIKEAYEKFGKSGITFLAIDAGVRDSLVRVRNYVKRYSLNYPVYFDPHQNTRTRFGLKGTPTIILLDRQGKEISRGDSIDLVAIGRLLH